MVLSNVLLSSCFLCFLYVVSAQDPLQGQLQQGRPCFETVKSPACNATLAQSFIPRSPNVVNAEPRTLVFLFTPRSQEAAESLHKCGGSLPPDSTYDPDADTEIFIHGWLHGVCRTAWMRECKAQLYERARKGNSSYNVILVDWTWGNTPDYLVASQNSKIVGEQIGFVIQNIMRQTGVGPEKFHIIGHSMGAISAGFSGRMVRGLRRITGLDPAYAPFGSAPPNQRLTYRDARIVDVIHTNSFNCFAIALGDDRQLGHADFYPNGGLRQPGCGFYILSSILQGSYLLALVSLDPRVCPHLLATEFYKLSIDSGGCEYVGVACDSYSEFLSGSCGKEWAVMGMNYELYHKNDGRRRRFYLTTTEVCPYYDDSYLGGKNFPFNTSCAAVPAIQTMQQVQNIQTSDIRQ